MRDAIGHAAQRLHALALDDLLLSRLQLGQRGRELAVARRGRLLGFAPLGDFVVEQRIRLRERRGPLAHAEFEIVMRLLERALRTLALDGVGHRPHQELVVHPAFHQIILGAELHGLDGQRHVVCPAQHHQRRVGRGLENAEKCLQPVAVRQRQIEQDQRATPRFQPRQRRGQRVRRFQTKVAQLRRGEELAKEVHVLRVVLDQQNGRELASHDRPPPTAQPRWQFQNEG